MKNSMIKILALSLSLIISFATFAQQEDIIKQMQQDIAELKAKSAAYDPLIPQMFAVDSKTQTMAVINPNENTVEVLNRVENGYEKIKVILVDEIAGIHDLTRIYRPQSIAIYENHILYLASNRDSSFVKILSMQGETQKEFCFIGAATAFSYEAASKQLYITGLNADGYNVFSIDVPNGFEKVDLSSADKFNYKKPLKSDEIQKHDQYGLGLTVIAVSTVFLALLLIAFVVFGEGKLLAYIQNSRARRIAKKEAEKNNTDVVTPAKKLSDISGQEYAAIAAAIYMYNDELHDEENTILTINKIQKSYSPWSSKFHNMNPYRR